MTVCVERCFLWVAVLSMVTVTLCAPRRGSLLEGKAALRRKKSRSRIGPNKSIPPAPRASANDDSIAKEYLAQYGYFREGKPLDFLQAPSSGSKTRPERDAESDAIRMFQAYFGLRQTGLLDKDTVTLMRKDRCGVADIPQEMSQGQPPQQLNREDPSDFALLGEKWEKDHLSWRLVQPTGQLRHDEQRRTMSDALNTWQEVAPLHFREGSRNEDVDIVIKFGARRHGDDYPFDGKGKVLAHAFGPGKHTISGDMHLDNDERWGVGEGAAGKSDLYIVATHELGHSLGLAHSREPGAIMYPYYGLTYKLGNDDIRAIQALYGTRIGRPYTARPRPRYTTRAPTTRRHVDRGVTQRPRPTTTTPPEDCVLQFDVVIQDEASARDVFTGIEGDQVYRFNSAGMLPGTPTPLNSRYPGAPSHAEVVFTIPERRATYFLKGNRVWRYTQLKLDADYPKDLDPSHFLETIRFALPLVDSRTGERRILLFGATRWIEYNFDVIPTQRPRPYEIAQYWPAVPRDVLYSVMGSDNNYYLISQDSHVIMDRFRRAVNGGKQNGHPKWMRPACLTHQAIVTNRPRDDQQESLKSGSSRTAFCSAVWILLLTLTAVITGQ